MILTAARIPYRSESFFWSEKLISRRNDVMIVAMGDLAWLSLEVIYLAHLHCRFREPDLCYERRTHMFHQANLLSAFQKTAPALMVITLFVLVEGQSVTSNVNQTTSQSPTPEIRKMLTHRSPKMPEKNTVAITAIRNLQGGDQWLRNLEIEVQNTSSRPIY